MRRLLALVVLVPLLAGCGWASLFFGGHRTSSIHAATTVLRPVAPSYVPRWVHLEHLPQKAVRGAVLFATTGCIACHTYAGSGSSNLNAPDLTSIGSRHLGISVQIHHLKNPSSVTPGSPMPPFKSLGRKRLHELAVFLEASKGIR